MTDIKVEHIPPEECLAELGVWDWPICTKEVSEFPWHYDEQERCYLLEGDVVVTPDDVVTMAHSQRHRNLEVSI